MAAVVTSETLAGENAIEPVRFSAAFIGLIGVLTLARLFAAAVVPLTEDEAYYRLWAAHLAFGYFDHPPMVAWWIAAGRSVFGDTPLGARMVPVLATTLVSFLIADIARLFGSSAKASERAAIWYNAAFLITLGGAVITPDAPATFFWTVTLWGLVKCWRSGVAAWWLLAGAAAGAATLSKYSGLFIGPGVLLWLMATPWGRTTLRTPWPWLALVVGGAVFTPNLVWNATHHWLSFDKQFSRIAPVSFTPRHVADFPLTQFFLLNPIVAVFAIRGLVRLPWRSPGSQGLLLLPLGVAPFCLYLVVHSVHAAVQAHWPAPLYPAFALLAARASEGETGLAWRRLARLAPWLGFGLSALVLIHIALPQTDWFGRKDPVRVLRGWPGFAMDVERLRSESQAGWTGTLSYGTAAELLAQGRTSAPVIELIERPRYSFQGPLPEPSGPGLVVELARRIALADLTPCFKAVRPLPALERGDAPGHGLAYSAFLVSGPKVNLTEDGCRLRKDRLPR